MSSPILDLAGVTLEVNRLPQALSFYAGVLGLRVAHRDDDAGLAVLHAGPHQTLTLYHPATRRPMLEWLAPLRPRGAAHLHYAWQTRPGDLTRCQERLSAQGVPWQQLNLGTSDRPDLGVYFFDPFGHGLEIREVDPQDGRRSALLPGEPVTDDGGVPLTGLREVALAFSDYPGMLERLPRAYGFAFAKEQDGRDFAQFTLAQGAQEDGHGTPARWLYAWDPQVGLADMLGGDHVLAEFYADVDEVQRRVQQAGLPHVEQGGVLAVRDPEGHVFVFRPLPE